MTNCAILNHEVLRKSVSMQKNEQQEDAISCQLSFSVSLLVDCKATVEVRK